MAAAECDHVCVASQRLTMYVRVNNMLLISPLENSGSSGDPLFQWVAVL